MQGFMNGFYKKTGKRVGDAVLALFVLIISLSVLVIIFMSLYFLTWENPLFIQKRPGLHHSLFNLYKIRTMYPNASARVTHYCLFLRKYSLDELPQFVNVLLGDMSVVGPRPLLEEYLPLYNASQLRRHEVRPGITGWAQINGRNAIPWPQRFALDVWYVENLSFSLDMKILWHTVRSFFSPKNVREEGLKEYEKFRGSLPLSKSANLEKFLSQEV